MKQYLFALSLAVLVSPAPSFAKTLHAKTPCVAAANTFDAAADSALAVMRVQAQKMGVGGVALVAYFQGDTIQSWTSKIIVVGRYKDLPTATDKGSNLLGIAYAKAAEMADTLKDSGSKVRPPMTGEFGWNGGVIGHVKSGYWIVAFSGGKSDDDVAISRTGLSNLETAPQ